MICLNLFTVDIIGTSSKSANIKEEMRVHRYFTGGIHFCF